MKICLLEGYNSLKPFAMLHSGKTSNLWNNFSPIGIE